MTDPNALLALYDEQLRPDFPDPAPAGTVVERDGPLVRVTGIGRGGFVTYRDLRGLDGAGIDELIARQVRIFTERRESVEWKYHSHDLPADLPARLLAAGFVPEEEETVVIGPVAPLAAAPLRDIPGVRLREVTSRADLDRIAGMEEAVWGDGSRGWLADALERELAADPTALTVVVAEADDVVVSAGWIRYVPGTGFAGLWGGSTLAEWRGKGIYKAVAEWRARLAAERGYSYLQVDASPDSRPILQRLGLIPVTTTTPYIFDGTSIIE
ncbi:GNAT family N-acetyltransferase [Allocatelliglobosispora scoriae]|uniref:GNAT family N-acetyltransferase n=1 Tax=Allocatelliglobosispora scoriae TaxID=643052 RepID=UPI001620A208|nr:GNAT family N-acetyltransferase [Allocatelliglobosispora scoriae]